MGPVKPPVWYVDVSQERPSFITTIVPTIDFDFYIPLHIRLQLLWLEWVGGRGMQTEAIKDAAGNETRYSLPDADIPNMSLLPRSHTHSFPKRYIMFSSLVMH